MQVLRAQHMGMCFGVKRAIVQAIAAAERVSLTILGELVHNDAVLADLRARGIRTCGEVDEIGTSTVMITAHGASECRISRLKARRLNVLNATCPLVSAAHRAVALLVSEGCHPVIVGRKDHAEVRGMTEDLDAYDVVLTDDDVDRLQEQPAFGVAAQTTQPVERLNRIAGLIQRRFPRSRVEVMNTVCLPTQLRQDAAEELARRVDTLVVVGGARSNNTRELVATCRRHCARVYHVQKASDVRPEWFDRASVVGITAGTSTPDEVIDDVEATVRRLAQTTVAA
jgi:4-hydroxy-3-methylbut-2-en-1-yl diphosphate reductase